MPGLATGSPKKHGTGKMNLGLLKEILERVKGSSIKSKIRVGLLKFIVSLNQGLDNL